MISKILRRNTSPARIAGFVVSNFIGLVIVLGAIQFFIDARSIWSGTDSFLRSDYIVVNRKVTSANTLGTAASGFSDADIADIESQPWVRSVGRFSANDFRVAASVAAGDRSMSTYMFFESIPDEYVDVPRSQWAWRPGAEEVPIILSKDYLTLYNFGFATSAGLPQLSEGLMSSIPLTLTLTSDDGTRRMRLHGRVAGYSNRLNTILVPQTFMEEANRTLGTGREREPSRLIIDVSSPGDVAIGKYLDSHGLELAGDKSASSASFLLRVVTGIIMAIGALITALSLFILLLSVSLIMEKNRDKLHSLLMLGYDPAEVGRPYARLAVTASAVSFILALGGVFALRAWYLGPLSGLGAGEGSVLPMLGAGVVMTALIIIFNLVSIRRRVTAAFRN